MKLPGIDRRRLTRETAHVDTSTEGEKPIEAFVAAGGTCWRRGGVVLIEDVRLLRFLPCSAFVGAIWAGPRSAMETQLVINQDAITDRDEDFFGVVTGLTDRAAHAACSFSAASCSRCEINN